MKRGVRRGVCMLGLCVGGVLAALPGCGSSPSAEPDAVVRTIPAPGYSTVAAKYNERVGRLDNLTARAVVRIAYTDEKGKPREEQGEGLLQVTRPDRLALSIKKAGKMLFWFGGDAERYWLFDVIDEPVVRVGRHELVSRRPADAGLGLDINPKELVRLLGVTPLPIVAAPKAGERAVPVEPGTTSWSKDGRWVNVTTPLPGGGTQVVSLDPTTYLPTRIALLDRNGVELIGATHELFDNVTIANYGGARPKFAGRVTAVHAASKTQIKLDLAEMRNSVASAKAFDFEELRTALAVDRVIDLDAPRPVPGGGPAAGGSKASGAVRPAPARSTAE